jgi:hypothetical protein
MLSFLTNVILVLAPGPDWELQPGRFDRIVNHRVVESLVFDVEQVLDDPAAPGSLAECAAEAIVVCGVGQVKSVRWTAGGTCDIECKTSTGS